jgi:uncharacterized DUF497 family protein
LLLLLGFEKGAGIRLETLAILWGDAMELVFEWDARKQQANLGKHGISFSEATSVFGDPLARIFADDEHSIDQRREIIIGHSRAKLLLLVCFTEPDEGRVRIISARRATKSEQRDYEDHITP